MLRLPIPPSEGELLSPDVPASAWFAFYAAQFDTVEINNSLYRLPEASVFRADAAPVGFLYDVKAAT